MATLSVAAPREQVALYSATTIMPGEELYVHYGNSYASRRDYPVGEPAKLLKRDVPRAQLPTHLVCDTHAVSKQF